MSIFLSHSYFSVEKYSFISPPALSAFGRFARVAENAELNVFFPLPLRRRQWKSTKQLMLQKSNETSVFIFRVFECHPSPSLFNRIPGALKAVFRKIVQEILNFIAFNPRHHHHAFFLRDPGHMRTKPL